MCAALFGGEEGSTLSADQLQLLRLMSGGPPGSGSDNLHRDRVGEREGGEEEEEVERRDESRVIKTHLEAMTFDTSTGRS